ncbi:hypothetical protein D9Q98_002136 [Chlorella vulgaris]|uniref:HhH-GPD domain-containing protein n=1 Tax=Chlorella vulgaris TaxID=3077 RepID=A0A9D4Z0L9_CHLVU|nr:hypothetical protein D9Q98_002136 [Chlorella vulgaris]
MNDNVAPVAAAVIEAEAVVSEAALLVEVDVTPPRKRGRPRKDAAASNAAQPVMALVEVATVAVAVAAAQTPPSTGKKKAGRRPASPSELVLTNQAALQYKAGRIAELLARLYPNPPIPLDHGSTFQLLCAVLLSAQTTDKKVNECTPALFQLAPDAAAMAAAEQADIQACIRSLGLAPTKAKNLKAMSQLLVEQHGGQVPASLAELELLPGVGHKTASVVMCQAFGQAAFPVDTHIHRLAQRWGLTDGKSVEQTEADLKLLFPEHQWKELHLQIIFFGREKCPAQRHDPVLCPVCAWAAVPPYNKAGSSPLKAGGAKAAKAVKAAAATTSRADGKAAKRGRS